MPAVNERALQKGPSLDADAIIVDLEDSVHPGAKNDARINVVRTFNELDYGSRQRVVRVNAVGSAWFKDDMRMLHDVKPDAVLLPKVETPAAISITHQHLQNIPGAANTEIWAMMETPLAVINAAAIAAVKTQINTFTTVCIGNNDLAREADMAVTSDRQLLMPWLLQIVLACKAYKLQVMDGVYNDFSDLAVPPLWLLIGVAALGPIVMNGVLPAHSVVMQEFETRYAVVQLMFLPRAIVRDVFTRDKSASMIGYMTTAMMVAPLFGPMLGGWVTDNLSWRWLYAGLGFCGLLFTCLAYLFLNETLAERADNAPRLSYFAASTVLLKLRTFIASALMMSGAIGMYYSFLAGAPYILLESRGLSASEYGMWFACVAIG